MKKKIKLLLFDIDGSAVPQGGWIDPLTATVFRILEGIGLLMGPATGKNADYARGMATGMGRKAWDIIIAESGSVLLILSNPGPPPTFRQLPLKTEGIADLIEFWNHIRLDPFSRKFRYRGGKEEYFRPELKESMLTLFPATSDLEVTRPWVSYFEEIIKTHQLHLIVQRHSDGCTDVVSSGVSKGQAVRLVCQLFNCRPEEIITVVDGVNDFELADGTMAIAPSNAVAEIKNLVSQQGGFLADYPDGKGFAQGILYFASQGIFGENSKRIVEVLSPFFPT